MLIVDYDYAILLFTKPYITKLQYSKYSGYKIELHKK